MYEELTEMMLKELIYLLKKKGKKRFSGIRDLQDAW